MSLLEDPEVKKTYDKCKYIVKVWEHKFTKKHKRIPSKLDIREAPDAVRHAYRKYFKLKTAALEESFMDVEGFEDDLEADNSLLVGQTEGNNIEYDLLSQLQLSNDNFTEETQDSGKSDSNNIEEEICDNQATSDVWGSHLNKPKSSLEKGECAKEKGVSEPVQSITKKLFCGSKFNKRNPRKSLSFSQKKNTATSFESPSFISQPEPVLGTFKSEEAFESLESESNSNFNFINKTVGSAESVKQIFCQPLPLNIVTSVLEQRNKQNLRKLDSGWLKRMAENTGISLENPELPQNLASVTNSSLSSTPSNKLTNMEALQTKIDYDSVDSDEIIEDSDEEQNASISAFHIAKKFKIASSSSFNNSKASVDKKVKENLVTDFSNVSFKENITTNSLEIKEDSNTSQKLLEDITNKPSVTENNIENSLDNLEELRIEEKTPKKVPKKQTRKQSTKKTQRKPKSATKKKVTITPDNSNEVSPSLRRSTRKNIVKASFEELGTDEEDPFASDNDEKDPEFVLSKDNDAKKAARIVFDFSEIEEEFNKSIEYVKEKKGKKKSSETSTSIGGPIKERKPRKSLKLKRKVEQSQEEVQNSEEQRTYELEYNVKPRIVAPRYSSIKSVIKEKLIEHSKQSDQPKDKMLESGSSISLTKDKREQAKEKLKQKIASGGLNDNFVTINLKKKVFARGKKGQNFSKYKKALWKSKKKALYGPDMDMGGCDGGKLTCFSCGQEGHFAQKCTAGKGDGLLPLDAEDTEECAFPTLEEASKMASESVLNIRKSKFLVKNKSMNSSKDDNETKPEKSDDEEENGKNEGRDNAKEGHTSSGEEWLEEIDEGALLAEVEKLEEHVKRLDVQEYMDNVKVVNPYYDLTEEETVTETPREVFEALEKFGHRSFRGGQEKAVMRILSGKSTLVTLSTGSGKSLCYQLPAYLYSQREPCITLVISPLVSLMEDQVVGIPKFLKAACLHTNQTENQRKQIMEAISMGELNVLLISPEAVVAGEKRTGFGSIFRKLPPIAFACIDEAHCVSQWSHNFRPSYLMICRVLRESLGVKTILGLTATATRATCESIIQSLDIPDGLEGVISDTPLPDNLHLTVSKDVNRDRALLNLLLSDRFKECKSIIVYCTRREECERIASFLRTSLKGESFEASTNNKKRKRLNLQAEPYHAGMSASRRRTVQNRFMSGELRLVVATVAFGMGINKSDIRAVIHFNMPNSFESYVQEVGRAGRDGFPAHCHVFLDSQGRDENELRRHIHANSIDRHIIRKLLQKIFVPCACKGSCPKHEVAFNIEQTVRALDIPEENISTLLCYLQLHEKKYIELLSPAYTMCKVVSYGGPQQIRKAAKECPPLAMALALYPGKEGEENILEFPVIDVASAMGWDSGICKHKLKNLEWTSVNNQPKRSTLSVYFSNLGFRLLAPGNLADEELDEALDSLYGKVLSQESKQLKQLHAVHKTLLGVAEKSYSTCVNVDDENKGNLALKGRIREYFNSADPLADIDINSSKINNEEQIINDIRAMICMYRDNQFTGRAIARIFHGIQSPNYPAVIWGRCKFWRSRLNEDFHEICRIATREIIRMR